MSACSRCHEREAVVHLTQLVDEQSTTLHLCSKCAAEQGIATPPTAPTTPLGSLLASLDLEAPAQLPPAEANESAVCDGCGATMADIRATGRLGCPGCWITFDRALRGLVRRLHGATRHVGAWYQPPDATGDREGERSLHERHRLEAALAEAIRREAFERAAELRDRLRSLREDG